MAQVQHPSGEVKRQDSFDRFAFIDPALKRNLESYSRFIFDRIAFPRGTPCGTLKNGKFYPKGDLSPIGLQEHAEGTAVLGVSLAKAPEGTAKAACYSLPNSSVTEAVGQGCRILSAFEQEAIPGVLEICPDSRVRVWVFFPSQVSTEEAYKYLRYLKKRSFVSNRGECFPRKGEAFLELPPFLHPETGKWSRLLTLEEGERFLEKKRLRNTPPDWSLLCRLGPSVRVQCEEPLLEFLEETYSDGWNGGTPILTRALEPSRTGAVSETANTGGSASLEKTGSDEGDHEAKEPCSTGAEPQPAEEKADPAAEREKKKKDGETEPDGSGPERKVFPLSEAVPAVIGRLLDSASAVVPTPGEVLNKLLSGGWTQQHLYLIAGPSGEGKTTFCCWVSDFAASREVPVLFVSFQLPREQMAMYALARKARLDSTLIQTCGRRRPEKDGEDAGGGAGSPELKRSETLHAPSDLSKRIISAGRSYFQTGDYFHMMEADVDTDLEDVRAALQATRERLGAARETPVLLVVDSLRDLQQASSDGKDSPSFGRTVRGLKKLASREKAAVLVTLDLVSSAPERPGWTSSFSAEEDPDYREVAPLVDTVFLIQTRTFRWKSFSAESKNPWKEERTSIDPLDRLLIDFGHPPRLVREVEEIRNRTAHDREAASVFCRLVTLKNRGGRTETHPLFRYDRAFHDFEPIELDTADFADSGLPRGTHSLLRVSGDQPPVEKGSCSRLPDSRSGRE